MAGADRMTVEEVVRKVLLDEHADVIREAVKAVAAEMMELEVSELIGAEHGERRPQDRATRRNGYRARRWDTRAGEIELQIPKIRQGSYFPSFLEPRRRSEQALLAVVQQAYVCGVSTRRVDQLVESLGLRVSKSEVSRRTDVVGIFRDDQSLVRLAGMLCIEQNDEWLVGRGYLSAEPISLVLAGPDDHPNNEIKEEVAQLQAA
jgi:transposase-like protein